MSVRVTWFRPLASEDSVIEVLRSCAKASAPNALRARILLGIRRMQPDGRTFNSESRPCPDDDCEGSPDTQ